ncbi:hypothetical protein AAIB33_10440 [Microbacterium sp. AZCO]|uniref:hypothetical protein n=1 Tax=Microbacterium sp. AZCO TaxID=3142976 RepID=UPI0031F3C499
MSAWGVGYRSGEVRPLSDDPNKLGGFVNRVVEWIPADVVALYAAAVTALQGSKSNPSFGWLIVFLIATPIISWLGVLAARKPFTWKALAAGLLAAAAFAIWSASVPFSGWWEIPAIAANPVAVAISCALGGAVFGLVASVVDDLIPAKRVFIRRA